MIRYRLRCARAHDFDAWFRDSAAFDDQAARGLLSCPECGTAEVAKAPMAPNIARSTRDAREGRELREEREGREEHDARGRAAPPPPAPAPAAAAPPPEPMLRAARLREELRELRRRVERTCDYVGPRFAEEARKIHYGDADPRAIYGEAAREDAEALAAEGVRFGSVPWLPKEDA